MSCFPQGEAEREADAHGGGDERGHVGTLGRRQTRHRQPTSPAQTRQRRAVLYPNNIDIASRLFFCYQVSLRMRNMLQTSALDLMHSLTFCKTIDRVTACV